MKQAILVVVLFAAMLSMAQPTTTPSFAGMFSYNMSTSTVPPGIQATYGPWLMNRFKFIIAPNSSTGSVDLSSYMGSGNAWASYAEGGGATLYVPELYQYIYPVAIANGFADPEGMLLHMNVNYTSTGDYNTIDQFDRYETSQATGGIGSGDPYYSVNGVFTLSGTTYTDVTRSAYCPSANSPAGSPCLTYTASPVTVTSKLLIGQGIPFDTVNVTVNSSTATGVSYWYWNGTTFSALTVADGTSGLTTTGTITFVPPANWARHVVNNSQPKYWIEVVVTGGSAVIGQLYGDDLMATGGQKRGWNVSTCVSGHANPGNAELEYCGNPAPTSSAKFRQQARVLGYNNKDNRFSLNFTNQQSGKMTVAYLAVATATGSLYLSGMNGSMFDNVAVVPSVAAYLTNSEFTSSSYAPLGTSGWAKATADTYAVTHTLLTASPKFWDGGNVAYPSLSAALSSGINTTMNWILSEALTSIDNGLSAPSADQLQMCNNVAWCPQGIGSNSRNVPELNMIRDNVNTQIKDSSGVYHLWDGANRRPMLTLATYWIMRTDNVALVYNSLGTASYSSVGDDYYYFDPPSTATLAGTGLAAQVCSVGSCTFDISQSLATTCSTWEIQCVVRIGGTDIVPVLNFTGTHLTVQNNNGDVGITHNHVAGETIEVVSNGHQSQDIPLNTPIYLYGSWFPAMGYNLGTPSNANGFAYPCSGTYLGTQNTPPFQCYWQAGSTITTDGCSGTTCSPLLRRDFSGGPYGNVIVLVRPSSVSVYNNPIATAEFETYSSPIALGGTFYPMNADGTFGASTNTATLRGGEAGIYVQNAGSGQYFFPFK